MKHGHHRHEPIKEAPAQRGALGAGHREARSDRPLRVGHFGLKRCPGRLPHEKDGSFR